MNGNGNGNKSSNKRYWVSLSCKVYSQEFYEAMVKLGFDDSVNIGKSGNALMMQYRTINKEGVKQVIRSVLHYAEIHQVADGLKVQVVTQPQCSACGVLCRFSLGGGVCEKCGGPVSRKRHILEELMATPVAMVEPSCEVAESC